MPGSVFTTVVSRGSTCYELGEWNVQLLPGISGSRATAKEGWSIGLDMTSMHVASSPDRKRRGLMVRDEVKVRSASRSSDRVVEDERREDCCVNDKCF